MVDSPVSSAENATKSVLMLAYWFPPEGNAAVYRPLRFVRNLPAFGWSTRVIAGDGPRERHDPELLVLVPPDVEIIRVRGEDLWQGIQRRRADRARQSDANVTANADQGRTPLSPTAEGSAFRARLRELVRRAESCWYHPDMQRPWARRAADAATAACRRQRPDVLWATGPPFSTFVAAREVSRRTGIPYVLDFRTSWTIVPSPFEAKRPWWAQRLDRRLLRSLFKHASAVVFFYAAEAECFWRMYRDVLDPSRIHVIPNGFDGEVEPFAAPDTKKFTVLYTGTLADYDYDAFLEAVAAFVRRDPRRRDQTSIQFVGEQDPSIAARVTQLGLEEVVSLRPPLSHVAVTALQRHAHALLMLERRPSHKGYELLAGAKLFGYLKAGKPILGILPHGVAERILRDVGVSTIAEARSTAQIEAVLELTFARWQDGTLNALVPDRSSCERYSGRAQTAALARALEGRPSEAPFVPGVNEVAPSLRQEFAASGWV